ncbi:MAG: thiamine-phosphate pyrophosphorylase [Endomicrobiia bacterium]
MNKNILRIIDANVNRSTEGIRVVEEILRFVYKDEKTYKKLRIIRHEIPKLFINFYPHSVLQRNSYIDPGKKSKEKKYKNIKHIVISNFHRVSESLRVLEEIAKMLQPKKVQKIKNLRYKIYDLEKFVVEKILR